MMRILAENKEAGVTLTYNYSMFHVNSAIGAHGFNHLKRALQFYDEKVAKALAPTTPPTDLEKMTKIAKELISLADEWVEEFRYADLAEEFDQLTQPPKPIVKEGWINLYDNGCGPRLGSKEIVWSTKAGAKTAVQNTDYLATVHIKWEE